MSRRGVVIRDLMVITQLPEFCFIELGAIISDDGIRDSEPVEYVLFNKFGGVCFGDVYQRFCLHPFGKIVCCNDCMLRSSLCFNKHRSYKIKTPHGERPWRREASEQFGGLPNVVGNLLARFITL